MNKTELIEALAKETELSKAAAGRAVAALVDIITKTVAKKQDVQLIGFGTFKAAKRAARKGRNPSTGAAIKIAASKSPKFSWTMTCGVDQPKWMAAHRATGPIEQCGANRMSCGWHSAAIFLPIHKPPQWARSG